VCCLRISNTMSMTRERENTRRLYHHDEQERVLQIKEFVCLCLCLTCTYTGYGEREKSDQLVRSDRGRET
jgi:hypothetical protein